mmetsp:Transcript_36506/g.85585  ORF Transcript_36506/g.85585 Transcript_36506/m.85585 type:complete len:109 (-) Transcript_36506:2877-3203(-)
MVPEGGTISRMTLPNFVEGVRCQEPLGSKGPHITLKLAICCFSWRSLPHWEVGEQPQLSTFHEQLSDIPGRRNPKLECLRPLDDEHLGRWSSTTCCSCGSTAMRRREG